MASPFHIEQNNSFIQNVNKHIIVYRLQNGIWKKKKNIVSCR